MAKTDILSASLEDYLEAIFHIVAEKHAAKAKDIAKRLNVNNSSVTGALRALSEKGLVNYAPYDVITLTLEGNRLAEGIVRKHEALRDFLVNILCIEEAEAEETACKMEHSVSHVILNKLILFMEFLESCPRYGDIWMKGFWEKCESICKPYEDCEICMSQCLEDFKKKRALAGESEETMLRELTPGQKGKILKIRGHEVSRQMSTAGVTPGSIIEVEGISPVGDSIDVKVRGYHLNIRNDDASKITVKLYI